MAAPTAATTGHSLQLGLYWVFLSVPLKDPPRPEAMGEEAAAGLGQVEGSVRNKEQPRNGELGIEKPVRVLIHKVTQPGIAAATWSSCRRGAAAGGEQLLEGSSCGAGGGEQPASMAPSSETHCSPIACLSKLKVSGRATVGQRDKQGRRCVIQEGRTPGDT